MPASLKPSCIFLSNALDLARPLHFMTWEILPIHKIMLPLCKQEISYMYAIHLFHEIYVYK